MITIDYIGPLVPLTPAARYLVLPHVRAHSDTLARDGRLYDADTLAWWLVVYSADCRAVTPCEAFGRAEGEESIGRAVCGSVPSQRMAWVARHIARRILARWRGPLARRPEWRPLWRSPIVPLDSSHTD